MLSGGRTGRFLTSLMLGALALASPPSAVEEAATQPSAKQRRLTLHVIPTGYRTGRFSVQVQIVCPVSSAAASVWQIHVTLLTDRQRLQNMDPRRVVRSALLSRPGRVHSLQISAPAGVMAVLELPLTIAPRPFAIAVKAFSPTTDETLFGSFSGTWPDPDSGRAVLGPIVVLQETVGQFSSFGADGSRQLSVGQGLLAQARHQPLRSDVRSVVIGIVCRGPAETGPLRVGRRLVGQEEVEFEDLEVEFGKERCVVLQQPIPARSWKPGLFLYQMRVFDGDSELARRTRVFSMVRHGS